MSVYGTVLFLHIVGLVLFFGAAVLVHAAGRRIRGASTGSELLVWLGFVRGAQPLFPVGGLLLLVTGLYLTGAQWGFGLAWIDVPLGVVLVLLPASPLLMRPRFMAMGKAAAQAGPGPLPAEVRRLACAPFVWAYQSMTAAAVIGIVWAMVQKPGWTGTAVPVVALAALGWGMGWSAARRSEAAATAGGAPPHARSSFGPQIP